MHLSSCRIERDLDPKRLLADLEQSRRFRSLEQPDTEHDGRWRGIPLWNGNGSLTDAGAKTLGLFEPTPVLAHCPYFREILESLGAPVRVARLLLLEPGGTIAPHRDQFGVSTGVMRLHIPIVTNDDVHFTLDGRREQWRAGQLWYGDFRQLHSVENRSKETRVHLVIDVNTNEALLAQFSAEFVDALREHEDIRVADAEYPATKEELSRFLGYFMLPAGVYLPIPLLGESKIVDGKLQTTIVGSGLSCRWVPTGPDRAYVYGAPDIQIERLGPSEGSTKLRLRAPALEEDSQEVRDVDLKLHPSVSWWRRSQIPFQVLAGTLLRSYTRVSNARARAANARQRVSAR